MTVQRLEIIKPDDWHLHLRDGAMLRAVLGDTARCFGRAMVMPNLPRPVASVAAARRYRERILRALAPETEFEPLMTLYLREDTTPQMVRAAAASAEVRAFKCYPAGATTHSSHGVRDLLALDRVLEAMQREQVPLLVHGEVVDPQVDVYDREKYFIERVMVPLVRRYPALKVVFEHATTTEAVDFVTGAREGIAATITAHHLLINRGALFEGGLRPHHYCLPLPKREVHRRALLGAATSGDRRFFLGTDSAPHPRRAKESACGCAGIYSAPVAIESYAEVFESVNALDRLEAFASLNGPVFYGLAPNHARLVLERSAQPAPPARRVGRDVVVAFRAGTMLPWRVRP